MSGARERLAEVLAYWYPDSGTGQAHTPEEHLMAADSLLSVVDRIAAERAAAELRAAAGDVDDGEFSDRWSAAARSAILARADALDPS